VLQPRGRVAAPEAHAMQPTPDSSNLPLFLRSPEAFSEHLSEQLAEQGNVEKGDSFLAFACKVLPLCEFWKDCSDPIPNEKKSHDKGVDFEARLGSAPIAGQSKFKIRDVAALDSVISKFADYDKGITRSTGPAQASLFATEGTAPARVSFVVVTSSNLEVIRRRYEESSLPSLSFYRQLLGEGRLHVVDGPQLLNILQSLYRQSYLIAPEIELNLVSEAIQVGDVYVSVVTAATLRSLYEKYGSSLFFENIRDFLGISGMGDEKDSDVNHAIAETLRYSPEKMLARNNGITFRADQVDQIGPKRVRLHRGSIVNGCQTTMCAVSTNGAAERAMIATKIVVGDDSWEVTKSANYQNRVTRIDLEVARFLRPQLVRKIATDLGYGMSATKEPSISNVLDDIHLTKISYEAVKLLYLGLFSDHPSNLFEGHYEAVRLNALNAIDALGKHEHTMRVLFQLWIQSGRARDALRGRYSKGGGDRILEVFNRFFDQSRLKYQCLLAILTACGCVDDDLMRKAPEAEQTRDRVLHFISRLEIVLVQRPDYYDRVFRHAFTTVTDRILSSKDDVRELMQSMFRDVVSASGSQFENLCLMLKTRMINDDAILGSRPDFGPELA
jgi:hypothetical protein